MDAHIAAWSDGAAAYDLLRPAPPALISYHLTCW